IKVENLPLKSALDLLLHDVHLAYVIKDEVLQITTQEIVEAHGKFLSITYQVGDLVGPCKTDQGGKLIRLITSTIDPRSWSDRGGPGTIDIDFPPRTLKIHQTAEVHEQVFDLIAALRRLLDQEVEFEVRLVRVSEDVFKGIGL